MVIEEGPQALAPVKDNITFPFWFAYEIKKSYCGRSRFTPSDLTYFCRDYIVRYKTRLLEKASFSMWNINKIQLNQLKLCKLTALVVEKNTHGSLSRHVTADECME